MQHHTFALKAALIGMLLNVVLSYTVTMLPGSDNQFLGEVIDMFGHHKRNLLSSSIIVAVAVFASVEATQRFW